MRRFISLLSIPLVIVWSGAAKDQKRTQAPAFGTWGVATRDISHTVEPGDDFYTYVNEGWLKSHKVPPGKNDFGAFDQLSDENGERIRDVITEAAKAKALQEGPERNVSDLYKAYTDTRLLDRLGTTPIRKDLDSIMSVRDLEGVATWMADVRSSSIVGLYVFVDSGAGGNVVYLDQQNAGQPILGLPNRDDYTKADKKAEETRLAYRAYVAATLDRAGIGNAPTRAADLLALETELAPLQWNVEQLADRVANYHPLTREELDKYAPGYPWHAFLNARKLGSVRRVILQTDSAVKAFAKVFAKTPVDVWRTYLAFHFIQNQVALLPTAFSNASWQFYQHRLFGFEKQRARNEAGIDFVNGNLGTEVGQLYVAKYFPSASRSAAIELFNYLKRAFAQSIRQADWLDTSTRNEAAAKLDAFSFRVGYPSVWPASTSAAISSTDLIGDAFRLQRAGWEKQLRSLAGQGSGAGWFQTPQTVNASYNPQTNSIELPAAMLQAPFFDPSADPAVNFGSIAAIIGHEMGHGFDNQGSKFDRAGRLRDWWSPESHRNFEARTSALVDQYNAYSPLKDVFVNGKQTLGENIGDLTGVSVAFRAYHLYLSEHGDGNAPVIDGFTGDQRFFLSWAQTWHYVAPDWAFKYIVANSYHSPAQFRVNGVVRNIDGWYHAFGVTPDQKLYLPYDRRVHLW